jgi:hypothetical protein
MSVPEVAFGEVRIRMERMLRVATPCAGAAESAHPALMKLEGRVYLALVLPRFEPGIAGVSDAGRGGSEQGKALRTCPKSSCAVPAYGDSLSNL